MCRSGSSFSSVLVLLTAPPRSSRFAISSRIGTILPSRMTFSGRFLRKASLDWGFRPISSSLLKSFTLSLPGLLSKSSSVLSMNFSRVPSGNLCLRIEGK